MVFFGRFCYFSVFFFCYRLPSGKGLIVLIFGLICYFSDFFSVAPLPPENFSADALACTQGSTQGYAAPRAPRKK